jgi:glycosyltransferase involved in cell wall biosynthesis
MSSSVAGKGGVVGTSTTTAGATGRSILFVIGTLELGGTESQLVMLAKELKLRGWTVQVFALSQGGVLRKQLDRAGIPVFHGFGLSSPPASPKNPEGDLVATARAWPTFEAVTRVGLAATQLIWRIALTRPDTVHAFLPLTNFLGAITGRVAFAPRIITSKRGLGNHQERRPRLKWMDRVANRLSHVVVANSHAVAADTAARDGYDLDLIQVIPNGLDLRRFESISHLRDENRRRLGLTSDELGIILVANLISYKGHTELIEAFALASKERPNLKLFFAGQDRGIGPALAEQARRLAVESKVHALGLQSDIPGLLAAMDVGVISSHEEGFCNALMEKLAAGLPVVATNVGGNPEALSGMPGCVLVEPRSAIDLARGLLAIISMLPESANDREFRQRMMRRRYSVETMVDAYEHLYLADG